MYKCGWQGCEKAYGTLNHLNAHVTMQSHGSKRTPEGTLNRKKGVLVVRITFVAILIAIPTGLSFETRKP